jgi:hypothetical protein
LPAAALVSAGCLGVVDDGVGLATAGLAAASAAGAG